jgi:hypothetical protein
MRTPYDMAEQEILWELKSDGKTDEEILRTLNLIADLLAKWRRLKAQTYETWGEAAYAKGAYFKEWPYKLGEEEAVLFRLSPRDINGYVNLADWVDEFTRRRTDEEKLAFLRNVNRKKLFPLIDLHDAIRGAVDKVIKGEAAEEIEKLVWAFFKEQNEPQPVIHDHVEERHKEIVRLRGEGNSLGKIGASLSMPKSTVQSELEKHAARRCACTD